MALSKKRRQKIEKILNDAYTLKGNLDRRLLVETSPREEAKLRLDLEETTNTIQKYQAILEGRQPDDLGQSWKIYAISTILAILLVSTGGLLVFINSSNQATPTVEAVNPLCQPYFETQKKNIANIAILEMRDANSDDNGTFLRSRVKSILSTYLKAEKFSLNLVADGVFVQCRKYFAYSAQPSIKSFSEKETFYQIFFEVLVPNSATPPKFDYPFPSSKECEIQLPIFEYLAYQIVAYLEPNAPVYITPVPKNKEDLFNGNTCTIFKLMQDGVQLYNQAKYNEAVAKFSEAIEKNSTNASAYYSLALAYYAQTKYSEAIDNFRKAVQYAPDAPNYWHWLGEALYDNERAEILKGSLLDQQAFLTVPGGSKQNFGQALDALEEAYKKDRYLVEARITLAKVYRERGQFPEATKILDELTQPSYLETFIQNKAKRQEEEQRLYLGVAKLEIYRRQNIPKALNALTKVENSLNETEKSTNNDVYYYLGVVYQIQNNIQEACKYLKNYATIINNQDITDAPLLQLQKKDTTQRMQNMKCRVI